MVCFVKDILTKEECEILTKKFDLDKKVNASLDREVYTGNSYGFEPSFIFNTYLNKLKYKILELNPKIEDLININTYVREYKNDSFLRKHIDREDLSITMSICLETTINKNWPIHMKIDDIEHSFDIKMGDGIILYNADKIPHWREILNCNENERVLQFFLHWNSVKYKNKKTKSLV